MEVKELGNGLILLRFEDAAQPAFIEKKGKPYILYGKDNDYPNYLLYLYNNSAKHNAIINGKVDYVAGKGWAYDKDAATAEQAVKAAAFIKQANSSGESLNDLLPKCELDTEIFNGYYLQIIWDKTGENIASIIHIDYSKVRSNADNTEFYVSDEWVKIMPDGSCKPNNNPVFETFKSFNPNSRKGPQILYVKMYHPGMDVYTLPAYRGSITWIEVDIEIGNYHLNNVKGGFFINKIVNFNNGRPTAEDQETIEKMFKTKFSGVRGQKFMLAFNADQSKATTVTDLNVAESDKLFDQLNKTGQQEIFTGHRITSPMLFGIRVEGQLGGRSEMRDAYEAFQNTYVNGRQQWHERVFNMLAQYAGVAVPLNIQRSEPIGFEFSEATISQNLTREEIRDYIADKLGIKLQKEPAQVQQATQQFSAADDERDASIFSEYGSRRQSFKIIRSRKVLFLDEAQEREHFATEQENLTRIQEGILDLLNKDPLITQEVMADTLETDVKVINSAVKDLETKGLIKSTEKNVKGDKVVERKPVRDAKRIIRDSNPVTRSIQVMYSYEGPKDDRNRPFCAKILELDRLYSRKEIEQISLRLGYSVWTRRGGWYTLPGTNIHRPYCRHSWVSNVVVKENTGNE